jgi:DNA primase
MQDANVAVKNITGRVNDRFYNRVMFPIFDVAGECIAFGGRVIGEGSPKYLNSSDTPLFRKSKVLFGLDKAKAAMAASGVAVVCEGYTDVIAMHEAGIKNAVATLGTALTSSHIKLLSRHAGKKIIYLFDGDSAGQRATDRALQFVDASLAAVGPGHVDLCALTLPDDLDPADYIAKFGGPALEAELGRAKPLVLFGIERRLAKYDLSSAESKYKALADALSILAPFKDTLLAKDYAVSIAGMLNIAEADVLAELAKQKAPAPITDPDDAEGISRGSAAAAQTRTGQGYGHSQAQGFGASLGVSAASYSPTEINRLKLERETLSVCAQNPFVALTYGPQLQAVKWHDQLHAQLAFTILQSLIENPLSSPADIITAASKLDTRAGSILTAAQNSNEPIESRMKYLLDELKKGDTDSEILRLKTQLKTASPQEQEQIFAKIVELQKQTTS